MKILIKMTIFLVIMVVALNYLGFCFSKMTRLSDAQITDAAILKIITYGSEPRFETVEEFKNAYPNCCAMSRTTDGFGDVINGIGPLFGLYTSSVMVSYERRIEGQLVGYRRHMYVRKCGEAFPGPGIKIGSTRQTGELALAGNVSSFSRRPPWRMCAQHCAKGKNRITGLACALRL